MGWASMNRCWRAIDAENRRARPADLRIVCPLPIPPSEQPPASSLQRHWARWISYPLRAASLGKVDAVHVLDHSFAELLRWAPASAKKIVTVHDVIPLIDPTGLSKKQVARFRDRMQWLHRADLVLCVSDFTRQSLQEHVQLDAAKLRVLPNGVDIPTLTTPLPIQPSGPKILLVGTNLERKNLRLVPQVLRHLTTQGHKPVILRVGPPLPPDVGTAIREIIGSDHLVELGLVDDATLAAAYASADLLLFPSTLEGFGLPVLEAMAHGCAVVCSNSSSLPEVAGNAALYFDPTDAATAATHCAQLLTSADCRSRMQALGQQRAQQLTWERHWSELCTIYREVIAA
jgi:glycosyltransferase involved in cell wall biosynthesis